MACTWLWGWTVTRIWSAARPNRTEASITSSPLFMRVAESMVILGPIFQVGWLSASLHGGAHDPLQVPVPERAAAGGDADLPHVLGARPARSWCRAQCSESTGSSSPPPSRQGLAHEGAAHHQAFLVGHADPPAGCAGRPPTLASPAAPTTAATTVSPPAARAQAMRPVHAVQDHRAVAELRRQPGGVLGPGQGHAGRDGTARTGPGTAPGCGRRPGPPPPAGPGGPPPRPGWRCRWSRCSRGWPGAAWFSSTRGRSGRRRRGPGAAKTRLSSRSSMPPWPGMDTPPRLESFTSRCASRCSPPGRPSGPRRPAAGRWRWRPPGSTG